MKQEQVAFEKNISGFWKCTIISLSPSARKEWAKGPVNSSVYCCSRLLWEKVWPICLFFISCCCFVSQVTGPMILQVQKLRNISAPKANEESIHAPRLLKIQLTDGHLTCHGLENSSIPDLRYEVTISKKWWFSQFYTMQCSVQWNLNLTELPRDWGSLFVILNTSM